MITTTPYSIKTFILIIFLEITLNYLNILLIFQILARSYIGVQNGRWMFDFVQGYLCEINPRTFAFGYRTVRGVGSCGCYGISSFERIAAFVFATQLDGIIDRFTFCNSGNNNNTYIYILHFT